MILIGKSDLLLRRGGYSDTHSLSCCLHFHVCVDWVGLPASVIICSAWSFAGRLCVKADYTVAVICIYVL